MGWWPLNLETGGIAWGGKGLKEGLMWGDSVADIVDEELSQFLKSVVPKIKKVYTDEIGRDIDPRELLCGLAFSMNAVEQHEKDLFGGDLPFTLLVSVGQVLDEEPSVEEILDEGGQ